MSAPFTAVNPGVSQQWPASEVAHELFKEERVGERRRKKKKKSDRQLEEVNSKRRAARAKEAEF